MNENENIESKDKKIVINVEKKASEIF